MIFMRAMTSDVVFLVERGKSRKYNLYVMELEIRVNIAHTRRDKMYAIV